MENEKKLHGPIEPQVVGTVPMQPLVVGRETLPILINLQHIIRLVRTQLL